VRRRRGTGERRLIKTSCQFAAGPEPEFAVDVTEVEFDGLRGDEQGGGGFLVGCPGGNGERDVQFLRGQ